MRGLVAFLLCAGCAGAPARFGATDRAAVADVLQAQAAAWNRGDLAGYMAAYAKTDSLVFTSGGRVRRGWRETFEAYRAQYATDPAAMGHLVFELLGVQPLGADGAVVLGTWRLTGSPSDGHGVFSVVFERRGGAWQIVHDHTSLGSADAPVLEERSPTVP